VDVDPGEKFEIGAQHPAVVAAIQKLAAEHRAAVEPVPSRLVERLPSESTR
jgi:hypothetical protein